MGTIQMSSHLQFHQTFKHFNAMLLLQKMIQKFLSKSLIPRTDIYGADYGVDSSWKAKIDILPVKYQSLSIHL